MTPISVTDLVAALAADAPPARIEGEGGRLLEGLATLASARGDQLSFLANPKYRAQLAATAAGAVIVGERLAGELQAAPFTRIVTRDPYLYYAKAARWFEARLHPQAAPRVHPSAVVHPDARVAADVDLGPHVVIEADAVVEAGVRIGAGSVIGSGCRIGRDTRIHPRVILYHGVCLGERCILHSGVVLGADGFGFAPDGERWEKIPQLGGVRIGDDVEIGANTTIDRGALDDTVIEEGVKLDNQIQVGHNVRIGAYTAIAGCTGIAGSTVIGRHCSIGGACAIIGHIHIADEVFLSAGSVLLGSITEPGRYTGVFPLDTHKAWEKNAAIVRQLTDLRQRLRALERE